MDWLRPCNVDPAGGWFGAGSIQGGPFPDDVVGHTFPSGRFGPRTPIDVDGDGIPDTGPFHSGLDMISAIPDRCPILAVGDGVIMGVITVSQSPKVGNVIMIDHENGWRSDYWHLREEPAFAIGDRVTSGQQINWAGTTGTSTGVHLHFELRRWDAAQGWVPLDPLMLLLAARDIGQPVPPPPPAVGDPSPALHWTQHANLQATFREGTVCMPETIIAATGTEVWHGGDGVARTLVVGRLCAEYRLLVPLGD